MSYKISPTTNHDHNGNHSPLLEEWVEIVEPKSKTIIYANLESGVCAKHPPNGVSVIKAEEFSDHWWELYDKRTGKYYYYNPKQQKTAWTKPSVNGSVDSRRILIIPVSKLQTFRRLSPNEQVKEKCDASTQTIASNLVSTGTQTIIESTLENELSDKLQIVDLNSNLAKSSFCTHSNDRKEPSSCYKSHLNHRQLSDFTGRHDTSNSGLVRMKSDGRDETDHVGSYESSQISTVSRCLVKENKGDSSDSPQFRSFGLPSSYRKDRRSMHIQPTSLNSFVNSQNGNHVPATSTFKDSTRQGFAIQDRELGQNSTQPMTTNNLSQYLLREARAMGIALISDDEMDDEEPESEDECGVDDDEDTDLRSEPSSHRDGASDLNASQDFGEDSSEGWKSFSDQESPNSAYNLQARRSVQKSPILCETSASFTYKELIDDQKDPASCMSQQLDHRKLVENFKKSRQTSAFGMTDSLGRSQKAETSYAVQKIKTVADSFFNNDREQLTDSHLRKLSTLSTLPRPRKETKDRSAATRPDGPVCDIDADYDLVEENCSYYSDSGRIQAVNATMIPDTNKSSQAQGVNMNISQQASSENFDRNKKTRGSNFSVESFARENLARHPKKGGLLFNRKFKWSRMITWTKNSIKQPMISSVSSDLNTDSIATFKLIQQFMGDRKITINKKYRQVLSQSGANNEPPIGKKSLGRSGSLGQNTNVVCTTNIPDRLRDELAYELAAKGCIKSPLRDEIFVQLARQLTENPSQDSVSWGLILMSILLNYFSPSNKFAPFLLSFLEFHSHPMAQDVCLPRLDKRLRQNWLSYCRKPADGKEIAIVRLSITKWPQYCGVFGESLERIMSLQVCSPYLKTLRLPWILATLGEKLIETGGAETEGIFRCAADHDLIAQLRLEIDCVDFRKITDAKQVRSLLANVHDPHVVAGLLKLFFRQLYEPVFPPHIYDLCLQNCNDAQMTCRIFNEHLSNINKDVVAYLIRLLQLLSENNKVVQTKMDNSNLSMVWAPNLLRVPERDPVGGIDSKSGSKWSIANGSQDDQSHQQMTNSSQSMIFEQTRQEMQFIRSLIIHLDTSFIKNVI